MKAEESEKWRIELSVRHWRCIGCGTLHDRDQNAAVNTLIAGAGTALERGAA